MIKIEMPGNGTVKITCSDDKVKRKAKVTKNGECYVYALMSGASVLPLSMGNGEYDIEIYEPLQGMAYKKVCAKVITDKSDGLSVFLCPNIIVDYMLDSMCADAAKSLFDKSLSKNKNIERIAEHIKGKLSYDYTKAENIRQSAYNDYTPDADVVYVRGEGICYDYAVVFAAMLRSVGIPCRVVFGRVNKGTVYHAWNEAYVNGGWVRYDLTFDDEGVTCGDYRAEKLF